MVIKFKHISISNFCGIKQLDTPLYDRTIIKGQNAAGKSTIKKTIQYALNIRDENGKEISGIRPHDENGVDFDGLTTVAQLTVSRDGVDNVLKKEFFQKKNRNGEYTGENDTFYYIDDVKKSAKKSYDEFVSTIISKESCINANVILEKDTAGRREMLNVFSKHTVDDIIDENPQFEELRGKLKANTVEDLKKTCREKINGTKGRNAKEGLNDVLNRIKIEIEFDESKKKDIDVAELELQRNALKEKISENKEKKDNISKQFEEYQKLSDGIMELKFDESDLHRKANEENIKKRRELDDKITDLKYAIDKCTRDCDISVLEIDKAKKNIECYELELNTVRDLWKSLNAMQFDKNEENCQMCGQRLPQEKIDMLVSDFEERKAKNLADTTDRGNKLKSLADSEKNRLKKLNEVFSELTKEKVNKKEELLNLEKQLSELPTSVDISGTEEYKAIKKKLLEKEQAMLNMNSASNIRELLEAEAEDLHIEYVEIEKKIAEAENNVKIDEHISELQGKQREVAQQIADVERELDLLKEFERKKAELLEKDVNENFEFAQVKMFDTFQNGEIKDICEFIYNGTSYDKNLNHGARILVEIDICRAFQKLYGITAPIIIDDAESVDGWRIPQMENQLIILKRTDDKELKVGEE